MNVHALQFNIAWEDKQANFAKVRQLLTISRPAPRALVVLPEMFATGFSMNVADIVEPYGGETERFLATLAPEFNIYVIGGVAVRGRDGKARNKALVFCPSGELIAHYAKMQPFTPGGERDHYAPGEKPVVFRWDDCIVSPFICYDVRFPELFRGVAKTHQPEVFTVIASWPEKRILHWVRLLQSRAIENQAYVVGVNRIGSDPYYNYSGRSIIVDADGEILADAGARETSISATLDLERLRKYRKGLPFLNDMRSHLPELGS